MSVLTITKENFTREITESDHPVLLDFWASWCGPCQIMSGVIDEFAEEASGVKVCKVNVDEQMELAKQFRVMSIPTLVVMKEGKVVSRTTGVKRKDQLEEMLA